jgi:hypothetical protein
MHVIPLVTLWIFMSSYLQSVGKQEDMQPFKDHSLGYIDPIVVLPHS